MKSNTLIRCLATGLILTTAGCGLFFNRVKPLEIDQSPDFDGDQLLRGGITIGVVVSFSPESLASETSRDALATSLQNRLLESHPDLKVLPPDRVQAVLGDSVYEAWVQEFEISGEVANEPITRLSADTVNSTKYLAMTRIYFDKTDTHEVDNFEYDRTAGVSTKTGSTYSTTRKTRMLVSIYECKTAALKWKGQFEAATTTERRLTEAQKEEHSDFDPLGDLASSMVDGLLGTSSEDPDEAYWPYQAPSPIEEQVDKMNKEFVKTLLPNEN